MSRVAFAQRKRLQCRFFSVSPLLPASKSHRGACGCIRQREVQAVLLRDLVKFDGGGKCVVVTRTESASALAYALRNDERTKWIIDRWQELMREVGLVEIECASLA